MSYVPPSPQYAPMPPNVFYGDPTSPSETFTRVRPNSAPLTPLTNTPPPIDPLLSTLARSHSSTSLAGHGSSTSDSPVSASPTAGTPVSNNNSGRSREDFPLADLDQLLRAVIDKNPFMAPKNQIGEKWKSVADTVQDAGFCIGRDSATLKNKVANLLAWAEVSDSPTFPFFILLTNYDTRGGRKSPVGPRLGGTPCVIQPRLHPSLAESTQSPI
jgi:hypothetical protein